MSHYTAIVIGATGATGSEVLVQLLSDSYFNKVIVFSRRPLALENDKLEMHVVDFDNIQSWGHLIKGDILYSALGTTLREAGSSTQQFKIDYSYQYEVAKAASDNGVGTYILVSSYGANAKSAIFYSRMKGQLDDAVQQLAFSKIHIFRPGILGRQNTRLRPVEKISIGIINFLNTLGLLRSQRPMPVALLAQKMILVSKKTDNHKTTIHSLGSIFNIE
ncbi:MAG: NAD-dependent epimerase/dehydratase family protein [Chitinophagia bacterium]|jgi:uncharacterized protein YbjT (DUF2867 family)|nr:NAD-dependent epimerase/dehydratase family protein [Chitinophagia bacterium]